MGNTQQQQSPQSAAPTTQSQDPAKKVLPRDPDHPTGIPMVDTGGMGPCKDLHHEGCFLSGDQRRALITKYETDLLSVRHNCKSALLQVKLEELIKNTNELPWYTSILLGAVAAVLTEGLSLVIASAAGALAKGLAAGGKAEALVAGSDLAKMRDLIAISLPPAAPSTLPRQVATQVVGAAKTAVTPPVTVAASHDSEATKEKAANLSYANMLGNTIDVQFASLSAKAPGALTDGELLALDESLAIEYHPETRYVAEYRAALARFMESPVSRIGRRLEWDNRRGTNRPVELETRVAWLLTRQGKKLVYVDRAFSTFQQQLVSMAGGVVERSPAYDAGRHQLSLRQDAEWTTNGKSEIAHERAIGPDLLVKFVEPEFERLAEQVHQEVWLAPPETFMFDYSRIPPRMVKVAS